MALIQARVAPTIQEKRYNTLNFLEASVMHGNLVKIQQIERYDTTSLSGELFTYKEPIETYITFDERPSVKLLRKYGWFREDQEIQPIVGYIPTHLLYHKELLNVYKDFENKGRPAELDRDNETLIFLSPDTTTAIYKANNEYMVYSLNINENEYELNIGLTTKLNNDFNNIEINNFYYNSYDSSILVTSDEGNRLYSLLSNQEYDLGDLATATILGHKQNNNKLVIQTPESINFYSGTTHPYTLNSIYYITDSEIVEYKSDVLFLLNNLNEIVMYKETEHKLITLATTHYALKYLYGQYSSKHNLALLITENKDLNIYELKLNRLEYRYSIDLGDIDLATTKLYINNNYAYVISRTEENNDITKLQVIEFNEEGFIPHDELIFNTIGLAHNFDYSTLVYRDNIIYVLGGSNGSYAKIEASNTENYNKAIANYVLLTGDDFQLIVETGESNDFVLKPLDIRRGTIIDIHYDFIENSENLFYVTDVKVDTVSINYVVNLMPYKRDQQPYGDKTSNTPMLTINTREVQL